MAWEAFKSSSLAKALADADQLVSVTDPEEQPYKSKYAAAETLAACRKQLQPFLTSNDPSEQVAAEQADAVLGCTSGMALLDADLLTEGQDLVSSALPVLEKDMALNALLLQQAYNSLGVLWSDRGEHKQAADLLLSADSIYKQYLSLPPTADTSPSGSESAATQPENVSGQSNTASTASSSNAAAGKSKPSDQAHQSEQTNGSGAGQNSMPDARSSKAQQVHLQTLFFLAQVYGLLSEEDKSAAYCGATLQGQLKQGALDAADWVRNATQLASFYMRKEEFAVAEHVLLAGSAVMERARNEEHAVDAEASANLALGWARLYLQRLATSRAEKERGEGLAVGKLQEVPDALRFDSLSLEAPAKLPWGTAALARDLEAAKGLFNASMRHFKIALEYFLLDGYVTEHCNILMHISSLYSSLAEFEPDVHHKCILHKARCKRVEPVLAQLNEAAFPGLCWSMRLEVANAYKEIMELKHEAGRPFPKVFAAAQEAKGQYDMFLDAFKKDGHLPNRVAETDNEAHFINACFSMARVAHRMQAPPSHRARGDVRMLQESVGYYQYIVDYVARNNVEEHRVQAGMCQEMVDLLTEHIDMIRAKEGEA